MSENEIIFQEEMSYERFASDPDWVHTDEDGGKRDDLDGLRGIDW